jgi:hypothetical protein
MDALDLVRDIRVAHPERHEIPSRRKLDASHKGRHPALRLWAYSDRLTKKDQQPPAEPLPALRWLERNTVAMSEFLPDGNGMATARAVLDRLSVKKDGKAASASTVIRKRMTLNNALEYACEKRWDT